jgi:hypothetical protein
MRRVWGALALVLLIASSANAQITPTSSERFAVGFQGGGSIDPEQFFAGVYWQSPELGGRIHIRPGLDGGFGNDIRLATINVDFVFYFPLGNSGWSLVQGGGPTVVITRFGESTDVGGGGSYVIGFAQQEGFFTEVRIGSGRAPSVKFGAGWAIRF